MKIYRFKNFYLNPTERRVIKNGQFLELTTKTFDVLQLLIENGNEVVSKDEILGKVWNGSFVEEGNLPVHISKLRRQLDEAKNQQFIETVQGSGYRFVQPVYEVSQAEWEKKLADVEPTPPDPGSREWIFDSIAVLPLQNENGDEDIEYLADGLTESFINSLSRLPNLKVIARNTVFRYKNKNVVPRDVGETLGVATILTGRIRIVKDHLIIGIELTKTEDRTQIWGTHFNRLFTDIFDIQKGIISEVLENFKSEINNATKNYSTNQITRNPESYKLYLKGKYFLDTWTKENLYKAIDCFEKSTTYDPCNIYSFVEIIECYFMLYICDYISYSDVLTKIKPILSIVSKMNQNIDILQAMYGGKKLYLDWEFNEAEKHFQKAISINSNCLIARHRYSITLIQSGKFIEALEELQKISLLDPLSVINLVRIGRIFYKLRRYEIAIYYLKEALELEPTNYIALTILGVILTEQEFYDGAALMLKTSLNSQFNIETLSCLGYLYAKKGDIAKAHQIIEQIKSSTENINHLGKLAKIYLALGDLDTTYALLDEAFDKHDVDLISIKFYHLWAPIMNQKRFKEFILKVGLSID